MENQFFPTVYYHFKVEEGFVKEKFNDICDGINDFISLPKLLHEIEQQDQTSEAQQAVDHLNILNSTLDA